MIGLLAALLIGLLVFYVIYLVIKNVIEPPFQKIALLIFAIILIIWLLSFLPGVPWHYDWYGGYGYHHASMVRP